MILAKGFVRAIVDNRTLALDDHAGWLSACEANPSPEIWVVVDRLSGSAVATRLQESLETAFAYGNGACAALLQESGWQPPGATAREVDYVDSGHIRLGTLTSFNPVEMEILDYEPGPPVPDPLEK